MKKTTSPSYLDFNGQLITNRRDIACHFNEYFTSIAHKLNNDKYGASNSQPSDSYKLFLKNRVSHSIYFANIECSEVTNIINNFNNNKSSDFSVRALKLIKHQIAPVLAVLFNDCMHSGVFPDGLKIARVLPLYKGGKTHLMSNYRPISILPLFSKIFEKLIYHRLYAFLDKYNILYKKQFGFRRNHSTTHALNIAISSIAKALNNNYKSMGIFIDFSKAFDTINHSILLKKLEHYGIRNQALLLITNYLSNRYQYVVCDGNASTILPVLNGVPQGSVLGPLLFILYVNDIIYCTCYCKGQQCESKDKCLDLATFILFADDTNIFVSGTSIKQLYYKANYILKHLMKYLDANYLHINTDKSKFIHFKSPKSNDINMNLNLGNKRLTCVKKTKFLGVFIEEKLNWKYHISSIAKRVSKTSGILYKIGRSLPISLRKSVFSELVNSHLSYCISVWGGNSNQLNNLFKVQKKALRALFRFRRSHKVGKVWKYGHTKPYFNDNTFLTVLNLYTYSTLVETFKILRSKQPAIVYSELFTVCHINKLRLNVPCGRLAAYSNNFYFKSPILWNALVSSKVVPKLTLSSIVSYFKRHVKIFLINIQKQFDTNEWHAYNTDFLNYISYKASV